METQKIPQIEILDLEEEDEMIFFNPTSQNGKTKRIEISVQHYCNDERGPTKASQNIINLEDYYDDDDDLHVLNFVPNNTPFVFKFRKPQPGFVCEICVEPKSPNESFTIKGCFHSYCTDCVVKYVASKLQESITTIGCPVAGCQGLLEPDYCRNILPQQVFDRWGNALCEAVIREDQKFYCPFKDCSALLIVDNRGSRKAIKESACPHCNRMFCAQCKVPWHIGIQCAQFQKKLNVNERNDNKLMKLAEKKKWKRCPNCSYYVEKTYGCDYINCRCGATFSYGKGTLLASSNVAPVNPMFPRYANAADFARRL
ncbi:RING-type domain-containing protein [Citrus sinensis]|nr:RING-type domain-containing protein [Citrus sinensis]